MPQSVTIDLPLVISPFDGLVLVRPVGFPDIAVAAGRQERAVAAARRKVTRTCRQRIGSELVESLVRGRPEMEKSSVEIAPPRRSLAWREPFEIEFDRVTWRQDDSLVVAYVPALDLTVVATPQADLDGLVGEQIRSAIRRHDAWSLPGLAAMRLHDGAKLGHQKMTLQVCTPAERARQEHEKPRSKTPTLRAVATRLRRQSLAPAFHREKEVEQLGQLLSAKNARSVLLVGPSGVGKTAVFHQWVRSRDDYGMAPVQCWSTDGSRIISGQSGFGMWQRQCLQMAEEARQYPSVVHLGNLVELSESGRLRGSGGCGSLLAPHLADGSLKSVIECTPEQLTRIQRAEPKLVSALTVMRVEEPTSSQTRSILLEAATAWKPIDVGEQFKRKKNKKRRREQARLLQVAPQVEPEALQILDRLHRRFRTDAACPGRPLAFFHAVMSEIESGGTLTAADVIAAFGRQTGLPHFLIDEAVRPDLDNIENQLNSQVLGQDAVIETLVDMIATLAADLSRGDRPLASLMLIGPTGVGKTETAKALARLIYSDVARLVRIDMSELSSPSAVGRLIGDATHPEGVLTSAVRAQPFSLVLLDEFEKAHPSVFDLLLQVLGEGRLTDGRGRLADFRNSIVLMTSNLGVDSFRPVPLGLANTQSQQRYRSHFERHLRDFLRPEMFNRIDRILTYQPLAQETVRRIAKLRLDELRRRDGWKSVGTELDVPDDALAALAANGYQAQYGARPLARELEQQVAAPLAEAICNAGRQSKLNAKVVLRSDELTNTERLSVDVRTLPPESSRSKQLTENALIEQVTMIRRRGQSLERCQAVRRLRNQYTLLTRTIKSRLRSTKSEERRNKIRFGRYGVERARLREKLRRVESLCDQINEAESDLLLQHYQGKSIDVEQATKDLERLKERLWKALCGLISESESESRRTTLIVTGPNLHVAERLFRGYLFATESRGWELSAHALLRRDPLDKDDKKIRCSGWCEKPAFRLLTDEVGVSDLAQAAGQSKNENDQAKLPKPKLAAYALNRMEALVSFPNETLGMMLTFDGDAAGLAMSGEAGVHTFGRSLTPPMSDGHSVLITKHGGLPIDYLAPTWLVHRDYQWTGQPRRWYDVESDLCQEMNVDQVRAIKMDREGRWLASIIEKEMERRVWSMLDEEDGSSPDDNDSMN